MRLFPAVLSLALACALLPLGVARAQTPPPAAGQPRTGAEARAEQKRLSEQYRAEQRRIEAAEQAAADKVSEEVNKRWEEMRARNAEQIKQFDEAVEDWAKGHRPAGTTEDFVSTSYNEDTALADSSRVTFYNRYNVPTHRVTFGPDAKPIGPVTLTQQGKVWETVGPMLKEGVTWAPIFGRDVYGEEIVVAAEIVEGSKVVGFYEFNAEGLPWRGQRWDLDGVSRGGFYDPKMEPPPRTVGGALAVPAAPRLLTGLCEACREKGERYNDLANQASGILAQMREQSALNQKAMPEAQVAIKQRYDKLAADLAALTPDLEAARAAALACQKTCDPQAQPQPDAIAAGPPASKLPAPDLTRPSLLPVAKLEPPASFCDEFARVAYMNEVYTPAAKASLANARTATEHLGKLGGMFTDYMKNEGGPGWAAVRAEQTAYGPVAESATADSNAINAMYQQILAIPIVPCPDQQPRIATGDPAPATPAAPVSDGVGVIPARNQVGKKPCPPKTPRKPIVVGPNSKVGSGAQLTKKLGGMLVGGLLGAAGVGGGGGGGGGPQMYTCKIKDSEMTLFTHPSGLALRVGAKRGKGDVVNIFADIAKSPDKGTFQAAMLEKPDGGQVQAPSDAGPCDLWGDWQLTVSWTKTTYVNGQMVSQESGGWSEGGKFSLPGMLTKSGPQPMWASMGFSSASHGARKAFMKFSVPQGGSPLTFVTYITQPGGDPVMAVPFVMTMTETSPGVFTFTEGEADCPEPLVGTSVSTTDQPPTGGTKTRVLDSTGQEPIEPKWYWSYIGSEVATLRELIDAGDKNPCDESYDAAVRQLQRIRKAIADVLGAGDPISDGGRQDISDTSKRLDQIEAELKDKMAARQASPCPPKTSTPPATSEVAPEDSILDEIDQTNPAFSPLDPLPPAASPPVSVPTAPMPQGGAMTATGTPAGAGLPVASPTPPATGQTPPVAAPTTPATYPGLERIDELISNPRLNSLIGPPREISDLKVFEEFLDATNKDELWNQQMMEKSRTACEAGRESPGERSGWEDKRGRMEDLLTMRLVQLRQMRPVGPNAAELQRRIDAEIIRGLDSYNGAKALPLPVCPPRQPQAPRPAPLPPQDPAESILDEIEEVFVPA